MTNNENPLAQKMTHWDHKYEELKAFKQIHGHCRVTPKANKSLATWLSSQRRLRRKCKNSDITLARLSKLEALGVDWDPKTSRANEEWKKNYEELKRFKEEYGHCDVVFVHSHYTPLGNWVTEQLRCYFNENYKKKTWTEKKFELLDSIGFDWNMVARRHEAQQNKIPNDDKEISLSVLKRPSYSSSIEGKAKKARKITKKEEQKITQTVASTTRASAPPTREETESESIETSVEQSSINTQNIIIKDEPDDENTVIVGRKTLNGRIQNLAEKFGVELNSSLSMKDRVSHLERCIENNESSGSIAFRIYSLEQELVMP